MATAVEFLAYVKRKFKRTDKDTEAYEAMTDTITDMRLQFDSELYKEETYVSGISTLGEYKLGLPSDFGRIIGNLSLSETGSDDFYNPLKKVSKQEYDELTPDRLLTTVAKMNKSLPQYFCIYANQIYISPVPDETTYRYQMNYVTEASSDITAATGIVPFTDKYRNTLRAGCLFELHDGLENYEEASYWKAVYQDGVNKIKDNDNQNIADSDVVQYNGV